MSQQATMTMAGMGGPVGAINAATPNNANIEIDPADYAKKLNTYIYDYFMRNQHYECARVMLTKNLPLHIHSNKSPANQRQANGLDDMDTDAKDVDRPKDLPLPELPLTGGHFLEDWWAQFWDIYMSRRRGSINAGTMNYVAFQRNAQKARSGMMGTAEPAMQRNYAMMNGGGMITGDLKKAAMQNAGNMNSSMQAQLARARAQGQPQMMQGNPMERQGSQMDARSGSPGSNGAPSPKRPRVEGNMQQMGQQRLGQPGQMPNNPGMPQNPAANLAAMQAAAAAANAQGSPMPQGAMDGVMADFQNGALRAGMPMNAAALQAQGPNAANNANGSHALQDYQMQLMLLEQQNKRRLLMARQEQDGIAHHQGVPNANGQGSPAPVAFDPSSLPPQMRTQMMMAGPNGPMGQRPNPQQMVQAQSQMEMFNRQAAGQMMVGNNFPQGMPPGLMPGQQPGQPGQTAPNMTPRQGSNQMPPPPAPQQNTTGGTNPSSPAAAAAPPTPSQTTKSKPAGKKETKASKAAAKKAGNTTAATPASEAEQPPTPTPQTPMTPLPGKGPNVNQNAAFTNGGIANANGAQANGQPQQPGHAPGVMQPPGQPDLAVGGFGMDSGDQFMLPDFSIDGNPGDVLENFDFDAFLNTTEGGDGLAFGDFTNFDGVGDVAATDALGQ